MFCAVYELLLKDEADDEEVIRIWRQMTLLMKQKTGAIGSRLHRDDSDRLRFLVYTQWPDRDQWLKGKRFLQNNDQGVHLMRSLTHLCRSKVICESSEVEDLMGISFHTTITMEDHGVRNDAPRFGDPHIMIYCGPDDHDSFYNSVSSIIIPLIRNKFKIAQLKHEHILHPISPCPWWANCVALFVDNDGGNSKLDKTIQQSLAHYFLNGGNLIFFCNPDDGEKSTWLLDIISSTTGSFTGDTWASDIGRIFTKCMKNETIPSNMQCIQVQKGDINIEYFVSLVQANDNSTPYMYLRSEHNCTIFVASKIDEKLKHNSDIWIHIIKLIGLSE